MILQKISKKKIIFITGGSGYVGSNLIKLLLKKKFFIFALSRKVRKNKNNLKWIKNSEIKKINTALKISNILIHLSAAGVYKKESLSLLKKKNVLEPLKLLDRAYHLNCKKWIILGSCFEYGNNLEAVNFKSILRPIDNYAKSKIEFFKKIFSRTKYKDVRLLYLRLFHAYGNNEPKKRLYPSLIFSIKKKSIFEMSEGTQTRDFIHIDQAVLKIFKGILLLNNMKNGKIVRHIASGKKSSLYKFVKKICKKNKSKITILRSNKSGKAQIDSIYSDKKSII